MDVFKLSGSVELNYNDVSKGLDKINAQAKTVDKGLNQMSSSSSKASTAMKKLGDIGQKGLATIDKWAKRGALALGGLASGFIAMGINANASLETSLTSWKTLLGTQENAKKMMDDITKYATKTPFSKMGVDEMAKQLHNAGFSGDKLFDQLTKFGNMGSAFGVQEDSLKEMVRQYAQVQMAGVAYTEDLNILQDRGIPIYKALSETLGVSVADIKKMCSEGKITTEVYNKALDKIASGTTGAMEAQSKTFSGMLSTIKDGITNITQKVLTPLFEKLVEYMPLITQVIDAFTKNLDEGNGIMDSFKMAIGEVFGEDTVDKINRVVTAVKFLVGAYIALKTVMAIAGVITALNTAFGILTGITGASAGATTVATGAQIGLNTALWACPITWIIALIVALVGAFILLWTKCDAFREFWEWTWEMVVLGFTTAKDFIVEKVTWLVDTAKEKFTELKDGLLKPVLWAKDKIKEGIDKIKGFFNFNWEFPKLKMPHFTVTGSMNPLNWFDEGIPKIGVEWYAKGGIMTQPTVFGMNGNKAMVGGEAGNEAILPLQPFYDYMDSKLDSIANRPFVIQIDGREFMRAIAGHQDELNRYNTRSAKMVY